VALALVTGGAGFLGSHLAQALVDRGYSVRVLDDLSTGNEQNLAGLDVDLTIGDVGDPQIVRKAISGADLVFHYAAMVSVPETMRDPISCYKTNLMGSVNVLQEALTAGVRAVVMASSAAVYGEADQPVSETSAVGPHSPYAASKLAMEAAARLYTKAYDLRTVCLRYFNIYGPKQSSDSPYSAVVPKFIQAMLRHQAPVIYGDGHQRRDFVYVADAVDLSVYAAEQDHTSHSIFNVSGGSSISILQLATLLQQLLPEAPAPIFEEPRLGDIRISMAILDRARNELSYQPAFDVEQGMKLTVEWFQSKRQRTAS
jgi:UDP-glucose 4-epimerase